MIFPVSPYSFSDLLSNCEMFSFFIYLAIVVPRRKNPKFSSETKDNKISVSRQVDHLCPLEKKVLSNLKQTQQKRWGYCRVDGGMRVI